LKVTILTRCIQVILGSLTPGHPFFLSFLFVAPASVRGSEKTPYKHSAIDSPSTAIFSTDRLLYERGSTNAHRVTQFAHYETTLDWNDGDAQDGLSGNPATFPLGRIRLRQQEDKPHKSHFLLADLHA